MLQFNPGLRLSASECLKHPVFVDYKLKKPPLPNEDISIDLPLYADGEMDYDEHMQLGLTRAEMMKMLIKEADVFKAPKTDNYKCDWHTAPRKKLSSKRKAFDLSQALNIVRMSNDSYLNVSSPDKKANADLPIGDSNEKTTEGILNRRSTIQRANATSKKTPKESTNVIQMANEGRTQFFTEKKKVPTSPVGINDIRSKHRKAHSRNHSSAFTH